MNARTSRPSASARTAAGQAPGTSAASALIYRGPQANPAVHAGPPVHAPNAALLIDFDNVTMGIQKDLHAELKALLGSEIIRGKVAVQRAYADWRRYPAYIVPLAESSIDMIMAPAYGTSKKNATDIRLAVDAMELVFTRPEIGTFILLSGDSDFASLVTKLKEYGKYVIGVGIRESSSDLLVMNCDEYYSYNALAGLVRSSDEEPVRKWDPWELLTESVQRMKRNGDVMRSDRLKQVMQELDASFDEKNEGYAKFSRFVQDAANRGLLTLTRLENGQLEVDVPTGATSTGTLASEPRREERPPRDRDERPARDREERSAARDERPVAVGVDEKETRDREEREGRTRRGRRGRGRGRDREPREAAESRGAVTTDRPTPTSQLELVDEAPARDSRARAPEPARAPRPQSDESIGTGGERLTREEAFDLIRRAVGTLTRDDDAVRASAVRRKAYDLLGRDSESLSERNFTRILRDAHDADVIDLRRRGDDFEVARAAEAAPVTEQLAKAATAAAPPPPPVAPRIGMGPRGGTARGRSGRPGAPPPELLSIGIVAPVGSPLTATPAAVSAAAGAPATPAPDVAAEAPARGRGASKRGAKQPSAKRDGKPGRATKRVPEAKHAASSGQSATVASDTAPVAKRGARKGAAKRAPAAKREGNRAAAKQTPNGKRTAE
jgi:uncharacterized protein (TIGR00288 family)